MRKRDVIQGTHDRLLDVASTAEAEMVMGDHCRELALQRDLSDSPHTEFEKSRAVIQPINSALGELAWRRVVEEMSGQYAQIGTLEKDNEASYEKFGSVQSPTLRRFMATMHAWLDPILQEVLNDAHAGKMPHAAVYTVMTPARARRREAASWQKEQALARGEKWPEAPEAVSEFYKTSWGEINLPVIAASVLGRAIAVNSENEMNTNELTSRLQDDLSLGADLSSVVNRITVPMIATAPLLFKHYAQWEQGKLSTGEFLAYCQTNPFYTSAEAHPTLKDGPWKNPGHCAADIRVGRPDSFPVCPEDFLGQLGVNDPDEITLTKLYVASANIIARDTVFTQLPK